MMRWCGEGLLFRLRFRDCRRAGVLQFRREERQNRRRSEEGSELWVVSVSAVPPHGPTRALAGSNRENRPLRGLAKKHPIDPRSASPEDATEQEHHADEHKSALADRSHHDRAHACRLCVPPLRKSSATEAPPGWTRSASGCSRITSNKISRPDERS